MMDMSNHHLISACGGFRQHTVSVSFMQFLKSDKVFIFIVVAWHSFHIDAIPLCDIFAFSERITEETNRDFWFSRMLI